MDRASITRGESSRPLMDRRSACRTLAGSAALAALAPLGAAASLAPAVPRFRRGLNITGWFCWTWDTSPEFFANYITGVDLDLIWGLGVRQVRLPVRPALIYDPANPGVPNPEILAELQVGVDKLLDRGFLVVLDMHEYESIMHNNDAYANGYIPFWSALAKAFKDRPPASLHLEIVNEPVYDGLEWKWFELQQKIHASIRDAAPDHTIIATGPNWGGIDGLLKLEPLPDPNVIYSFHTYTPFLFTHQGATWTGMKDLDKLKDVPYPTREPECTNAKNAQVSRQASEYAQSHCDQFWNAAKVYEDIQRAKDWSIQHGNLRIVCGEFGVLSWNTPPADRLALLKDYANAFNSKAIPWTVWGYDEAFSLAAKKVNNIITYDKAAAAALGFKVI